jgi:hypothetical protein
MIRSTLALAALAALGLGACQTPTTPPNALSNGMHSVALENENANNLNANSSVQPGAAGPSPSGGYSNPGTSGTITSHPGGPPEPR